MSAERRYQTIIAQKQAKIFRIILNRPQRMNAINPEMLEELSWAIDQLELDKEIRVVVISGAGERAFSVGVDITGFRPDPIGAAHLSLKGHQLLESIESSSKIYIAAIHGYCLGGGLELVLACDFRIAAENAELGAPEINLGIIPGWGATQRLSRMLGIGRAKELIMLGERIPAAKALEMGLVHKVVPAKDLDSEAMALAARLADGPPLALRAAKHAINFGAQVPLGVGLRLESNLFSGLFSTKDMIEGVEAFLSKRKPEFKGE